MNLHLSSVERLWRLCCRYAVQLIASCRRTGPESVFRACFASFPLIIGDSCFSLIEEPHRPPKRQVRRWVREVHAIDIYVKIDIRHTP
jgi:hypothetical protein